eukprot:gene8705-6121_t
MGEQRAFSVHSVTEYNRGDAHPSIASPLHLPFLLLTLSKQRQIVLWCLHRSAEERLHEHTSIYSSSFARMRAESTTNRNGSTTMPLPSPNVREKARHASVSDGGDTARLTERNMLSTSFAISPGKELGTLSRIRTGRDTTTLYVQTGGGSESRISLAPAPAPKSPALDPPGKDAAEGGASGGANRLEAGAIAEKLTGLATSATEAVPSILNQLRQTLVLVFVVILALLFCQIVSLWVSQTALNSAITVQTYKNSQHVQIASHLTHQLLELKDAAEQMEAQLSALGQNALLDEEYQGLHFDIRGVDAARRQSLEVLHAAARYRGPLEDVEFLVDQHVAYERRIKELAKEEITWLGIVTRREHHRLHRRLENSLSQRHPLYSVSAQAFELSAKWMDNFYGDEELTRRHWECGDEERRRAVSELSSQLAISFEDVHVETPSWGSWWRFSWGRHHRRGMRKRLSSRWTLLIILLVLIFCFSSLGGSAGASKNACDPLWILDLPYATEAQRTEKTDREIATPANDELFGFYTITLSSDRPEEVAVLPLLHGVLCDVVIRQRCTDPAVCFHRGALVPPPLAMRCCAPTKQLVRCTRRLGMRFDKDGAAGRAGPDGIAAWVSSAAAGLPPSMRPKTVAPDFTPFPLARHDAALGFGPTTLQDIPDVLTAQQRMSVAKKEAPALSLEEQEREQAVASGVAVGDASTPAATPFPTGISAPHAAPSPPPYVVVGDASLKVMDRVECRRSIDDLVEQFRSRPEREARAATVLDLAATLSRRSDTEVVRMLEELSAPFSIDGNGLQFLTTKVVKFGRPYWVGSELMNAYIALVEAATDFFTLVEPGRLAASPQVCAQLLHFFALIRLLEPNRWFSPNPNSPSNRGDYSHPRGVNLLIAHRGLGEPLLDAMEGLVTSSHPGFFNACTLTDLVDLLRGFAAVEPSGRPRGEVLEGLWRHVRRHLAAADAPAAEPLEKLYFTLASVGAAEKRHAVLQLLLRLATGPTGLLLGPDVFAAASQERDEDLKQRLVVDHLERSLAAAAQDTMGPAATQRLLGLVEASQELLMSLKDKAWATEFARRHQYDRVSLEGVGEGHEVVGERLQLEAITREKGIPAVALLGHTASGSRTTLLELLAQGKCPQREDRYLTRYRRKRAHPVRTLLSDLPHIRGLTSIFLFHSSAVRSSVQPLLSAAHRARGGKETMICTAQSLQALAALAHYGCGDGKASEPDTARRALVILAQELCKGRMVLLPFTEELLLHDAGVACGEDLMLWTVAAFLAREIPLVKVHTLLHPFSIARRPYHMLKGGHSTLRSTEDLYNRATPLLAAMSSKLLPSVTHHVRLQQPVRDPPNRLHKINPVRARFLYRRDKALFDKFHVTARNVPPGFAQGALDSDLRGLGFYTPDHPQKTMPPSKMVTNSTAIPFPEPSTYQSRRTEQETLTQRHPSIQKKDAVR